MKVRAHFALFVARRYLFSRKKRHAINIISTISAVVVAIVTMALVVILSAFNGLDALVKSLFNAFDPDIKITLREGKNFNPQSASIDEIAQLPGVFLYSEVLEENALLVYGEKTHIGTMKGVDDNFVQLSGIDSMIVEGYYQLKYENYPQAVIGYLVAFHLSIGLRLDQPLEVYVPRRSAKASADPSDAFKSRAIYPSGIFQIQQEFDAQYIIVPIDFARNLLDYQNEVSAIEIKLDSTLTWRETLAVQEQIASKAGKDFAVKNRFQQHELLYKIMQSEKWAIFAILAFILLIASFNVVGSLTMLLIDKKDDVLTLRSLGANTQTIRTIFLLEGWLISIIGAVLGLAMGYLICFLQIKYGFITFPSEGFIIDRYPVEVYWVDFLAIFFAVLLIGFVAAWYPVRRITKKHLVLG